MTPDDIEELADEAARNCADAPRLADLANVRDRDRRGDGDGE